MVDKSFLRREILHLRRPFQNLPVLGGRRRGFMLRVSVSSSIIHRVLSLCLQLSSLNLCHLISAVDMILFGLDCLSVLY